MYRVTVAKGRFHYLLGDLERLLDFLGLAERRGRLGLADLEADRRGDLDLDLPTLLGDLLGDGLRRGGERPLKPLGDGLRLGGDLLQYLPPLRGGRGARRLGDTPRLGDLSLATARVTKRNFADTKLPSICPPSMLNLAFSPSSCFSNSTYA